MRLIRLDTVRDSPWRNGGGSTRELLRWCTADAADEVDWNVRVSVARIEAAAPFSTFAGVTRWIAVVEGEGIRMRVDGSPHRLDAASAALCFDGAALAAAEPLSGPTRDLNLMLHGVDGVLVRATREPLALPPTALALGLYTHGAGTLHEGGLPHAIPARTLAWFDPPPPACRFEGDSPAFWMLVLPAPSR